MLDWVAWIDQSEPKKYPWGRLDYICNSKTNKSVSVILGKLICKQFESVSVISGVQV